MVIVLLYPGMAIVTILHWNTEYTGHTLRKIIAIYLVYCL